MPSSWEYARHTVSAYRLTNDDVEGDWENRGRVPHEQHDAVMFALDGFVLNIVGAFVIVFSYTGAK